MAARKHPNYVLKVGTDGRRYFKPAFVAGVVADLRAGKRTIDSVAQEFKISESLVYRWLNRNQAGKPPGRPRTRVPASVDLTAGAPSGMTLLEQARELRPHVEPVQNGVDKHINQHIELAEAFIRGEIGELQVKHVLGKDRERKFMVTVWLGHVFAGAVRSGRSLKL